MENNKYSELDKTISAKIMGEFKGQVIEHVYPQCRGEGEINDFECDNCEGSGIIKIQY